MKKKTPSLLFTAALLGASIVPSHAVVLFLDNFDATGAGTPNDQITNPGRQTGTLATLGYLQRGNVQIGNTGTLPHSPGSDIGDELLTAFGGVAMIDHDFSTVTSPLVVTWTGIIASNGSGSTTDDWTTLIVGNPTGVPFVTSAGVSSILMRASGGSQIIDHGVATTGGNFTATGLDAWTQYMVVLSDTAGTGSAFGSAGSRADYYVAGTLVGTANLTQLTAGQGFLGFSSNRINGYDNISVATVPEASTTLVSLAGLAGLALVRRRK